MARLVILFTFISSFFIPSFAVDEQKEIPTVFKATAKEIDLFENLLYPAKVNARIMSKVVAEDQGVIKDLLAPLGTKVVKGQKLISIVRKDPVYRYRPLWITAPTAGVVSSVSVGEGTEVARGESLMTILDPRGLKVAIELTPEDSEFVAPKMRGTLNYGKNQTVAVEVIGVSPMIDPLTGTSTVEFKLVGEAPQLKAGMLGKVSMKVNERKGIRIPEYAVVFKGDKTFIRLLDGNKVKMNPITLGAKNRGQVEILEGLKDKEDFIERASDFIADGMEVQFAKKEAKK